MDEDSDDVRLPIPDSSDLIAMSGIEEPDEGSCLCRVRPDGSESWHIAPPQGHGDRWTQARSRAVI